ncbi:olfactory receptor 1J4-like [Phacochoerus africanus]|uniref:olfactory receptor 1J4-like n=1 Tax=Phacochoerus africanus TaxID=41426 RepID=UPI001FD89AB6|nr:olfactory receptor 1J4-like [Phacochoerus africanus]
MAYNKYMAICHPLHYSAIMRQELCFYLVAGPWFLCCIHTLLHTLLLVQLSFSIDNIISHFCCLFTSFLKLSCSDTSLNDMVLFTAGGRLFILPLCRILGSYILIGTAVLRVSSTKRLFKFVPPVNFYLFLVSSYYGTLASVSFFSSSWNSNDKDIIASVVYAVISPLLNHFTYSLRNRDIKETLEIFIHMPNFLK